MEALVREKGQCQICKFDSISNDAHHIWYPEGIYDTKSDQLVVLCRACHDFIHAVTDCKTNDENHGRCEWSKFRNAIMDWRIESMKLFHPDSMDLKSPKQLRDAYVSLSEKHSELDRKFKALTKEHAAVCALLKVAELEFQI